MPAVELCSYYMRLACACRADEEWVEVARALEKELGGMVHVVGRSKNQIVVVSQDYIMETFTVGSVVYNYKQV